MEAAAKFQQWFSPKQLSGAVTEATEVMPGSRKPAGSGLFNGAGKELERGVKQDMAIGVLLM